MFFKKTIEDIDTDIMSEKQRYSIEVKALLILLADKTKRKISLAERAMLLSEKELLTDATLQWQLVFVLLCCSIHKVIS